MRQRGREAERQRGREAESFHKYSEEAERQNLRHRVIHRQRGRDSR